MDSHTFRNLLSGAKRDDRFFPANQRERVILSTLVGDSLERYKRLRHQGCQVMEALKEVDQDLHSKMNSEVS